MTDKVDWERLASGVWRRRGESPRLALVGSVHGDETHGAQVVRELIAGGLPSIPGRPDRDVTLAIGNPEAVELGQRGTVLEADLNRLFGEDKEPSTGTAEQRRAQELRDALHGVHELVDLHQTSCETPPLAVGPATAAHVAQTARLGLEILVTGVERLYGGGMLSEWVDRRGGLGITVETGRKGTASSLAVARDVARRFLVGGDPLIERVRVYEIQEPIFAPGAGLRFVRPLSNATSVVAGEVLGTTNSGPLRAPADGAIFLPREESGTMKPCLIFARDLGFSETIRSQG